MSDIEDLQYKLEYKFAPYLSRVMRPARGLLKHDFIVPGGPYEEQWDWDAFFVGMALSEIDKSNAKYLRNWALNYIENSSNSGFTPGLVTPEGPDSRLPQMKPFLAQGCFHASQYLNDFSWLQQENRLSQLEQIVTYRERNGYFVSQYGLAVWQNSMESGADNYPSFLNYPEKTVIAPDVNVYIYLEYLSLSKIFSSLGNTQKSEIYDKKSKDIQTAILTHLWDKEDSAFYCIHSGNSEYIKNIGYANIHPFWAKIASQKQADAFIELHVLNPEKLRSSFGIRTLSKDDPNYNNVNMIKPHSNWQGPIWPIANYFFIHSLAQYGYENESEKIAKEVISICLEDIETSGGMHENYDAETGKPLAAPNFISWNLLFYSILHQLQTNRNPCLVL